MFFSEGTSHASEDQRYSKQHNENSSTHNLNSECPSYDASLKPHDTSSLSGHINVIRLSSNYVSDACQEGNISTIKSLIENGDDYNTIDNFWAACFGGNIEIINLLKDCDLDKSDKDGITTLMHACRRGNLSIVESLTKRGADIEITDNDGNTAFSLVCYHGHIAIIEHLLDIGSDINKLDKDGMTPLLRACHQGYKSIVESLIGRGANCKISDKNGKTPLLLSSYHGYLDIVDLLAFLSDVNKTDKDGMTPLMHVCRRGNLELVKRLIGLGAKTNISDKIGHTPLSLSHDHGFYDIENYLSEKDCDTNKPDNDGKPH